MGMISRKICYLWYCFEYCIKKKLHNNCCYFECLFQAANVVIRSAVKGCSSDRLFTGSCQLFSVRAILLLTASIKPSQYNTHTRGVPVSIVVWQQRNERKILMTNERKCLNFVNKITRVWTCILTFQAWPINDHIKWKGSVNDFPLVIVRSTYFGY